MFLRTENRELRTAFMKRIRYSKYVPDPASEMSMEDLLSALSDYFLQSGFNDNFWYELPEGEQNAGRIKTRARTGAAQWRDV